MEAINQLTGILTGLGVNSTLWIQLGLFLLTFVLVNNLVFKPFQNAFQERHHKTFGSEDITKQLMAEAQEIQGRYETRARQVNLEIKSAYDLALGQAYKKQSEILDETRKQSGDSIKKAREQIASQVGDARTQLEKDLPTISALIAAKLIGKDLA